MQSIVPQKFVEAFESDPLLAAEGMDIDAAEIALDGFETVAAEFERMSSEGSLSHRLYWKLFPLARTVLQVPFLRAFISSERHRRIFFSDRSRKNAERLVDAWDVAAKKFSQGVRRYTLVHRLLWRLSPKDTRIPIQDFLGNITGTEDIVRQLALLKENGRLLSRCVAQRKRLLAGQEVTLTPAPTDQTDLRWVPGELEPRYARLYELEIEHGVSFRHGTILEQYGPFSFTLSNFDDVPTRHNFMAHIVRQNESGIRDIQMTAIDVYAFMKLTRSSIENQPTAHQFLIDRGIPYWYQTATSMYTSRDQSYLAAIATIVDVQRRPNVNTAQVRRQQSSMLDLLLGKCLSTLYLNMGNAREYMKRGTFTLQRRWYFLFTNTYPSLLFLTFNGSVWRLPRKPEFLGSSRAKPEERIFQSADMVLPLLSEHEVELVMKGGRIREEARKAAGIDNQSAFRK